MLSHMMPFFVGLECGHIKEPIWFECDEVELVSPSGGTRFRLDGANGLIMQIN